MKKIYKKLKIAITVLLFFLIPAIGFGQTKVGGIVTDENKLPLPGVNVTIKGGQKGTVTDIDGRFEIKANSDQTLVFSFIGYDKKEVLVGNNTVINVSMQ